MSKTKAQLEEIISVWEKDYADLEADYAKLQTALNSGDGEEIPEHGHSRHESRQERQNRLRSLHMKDELKVLSA